MKLINLSKKGEMYSVKAQTSFKVFGFNISHTVQEFVRPFSEDNWYDLEGRKVSEKKASILNKWLRDHQRFIE